VPWLDRQWPWSGHRLPRRGLDRTVAGREYTSGTCALSRFPWRAWSRQRTDAPGGQPNDEAVAATGPVGAGGGDRTVVLLLEDLDPTCTGSGGWATRPAPRLATTERAPCSLMEHEDALIEKVLVTGGCGRLGHYVVDELRDAYQITTLDVADSLLGLPHLRLSILDLPGLRQASAGQDAVVHLAALDATW
jgi:hypothetical protein